MHLRTFGRWAENAGNRLTFGRWVSPRQGYVQGCGTATASNHGICCRCGRRMEWQSRSESSWQWFCRKGGTATAPNRGICCRCGRRMEWQSRSESPWRWLCRKGGTATAPNRWICCRCGKMGRWAENGGGRTKMAMPQITVRRPSRPDAVPDGGQRSG